MLIVRQKKEEETPTYPLNTFLLLTGELVVPCPAALPSLVPGSENNNINNNNNFLDKVIR